MTASTPTAERQLGALARYYRGRADAVAVHLKVRGRICCPLEEDPTTSAIHDNALLREAALWVQLAGELDAYLAPDTPRPTDADVQLEIAL